MTALLLTLIAIYLIVRADRRRTRRLMQEEFAAIKALAPVVNALARGQDEASFILAAEVAFGHMRYLCWMSGQDFDAMRRAVR